MIGPLADLKAGHDGVVEPWRGTTTIRVTVLEGIRNRFAEWGDDSEREGGGDHAWIEDDLPMNSSRVRQPTLTTDKERDAESSSGRSGWWKESEVSVLVLGESQDMSGERASRSSLMLPGRQEELLEAAVATGKPVVDAAAKLRDRWTWTWAAEHAPAILEMWYPGTEGGNAAADVLFGDAVPGGKLPFAWPRSVGQIPINYARNLTQIPEDTDHRYWDGLSTPLYPFGYGLSYATFAVW